MSRERPMGDGMGKAAYKNAFRARKFLEQAGQCWWCKGRMTMSRTRNGGPARDFATFEHLMPRVHGGQINEDNIVLAHRKCNSKRNAKMQEAAGFGLTDVDLERAELAKRGVRS